MQGEPALFNQHTIRSSVSFEGIGLHSGKPSTMTVSPAKPGSGIVFVSRGVAIEASYENIVDTGFATTIGADGVGVRTVEHLLAALSGLGIDNVVINIDGPEVPVMDGSSAPFVKGLKDAGIVEQDARRRYIKIIKTVSVQEGDKSAKLLPSPVPMVSYRIDFNHPMIAEQSLTIELDPDSFAREIASTRTFGFLRDVEALQKAGLALGGSMDNAVVMDDGKVLNEDGLRFPDEFVRHKILDALGDISLAGMPIIGHLVADKSGHELNRRLVGELMANRDCWVVLEGVDEPAMAASASLSDAAA